PNLSVENQACSGAVSEQSSLAVRDPSLGGPDAATSAQHDALGGNQTRFGGDGTGEGKLEFEGRLADAPVESREDRQSHAAIEQRRGKSTVDCASRIEQGVIRFGSYHDTPALDLRDVITQCPSDCVER